MVESTNGVFMAVPVLLWNPFSHGRHLDDDAISFDDQ
jgi:hypothetical protein